MAEIKFTGNTGKEAELRFTPSGRAVLNFSVADSKSKKLDNGEWEKLNEQWLNVTVWGELAEFYSDKLPKGSRVTVYGEFYSRKYENKDGTPGMSLDVTAKGIDIMPSKNGGQQRQQTHAPANDPWGTPEPSQDPGSWGTGPGGTQDPPF